MTTNLAVQVFLFANMETSTAYLTPMGPQYHRLATWFTLPIIVFSLRAVFIQRHDLALTLSNRQRLRNPLPLTLCPGTWRCHRARWIGKPRKQGSVRTAERLAGLSCDPAEFHHLCCLPVSLASWTDSVLDRVPLADAETRPPEGHRYCRAGP